MEVFEDELSQATNLRRCIEGCSTMIYVEREMRSYRSLCAYIVGMVAASAAVRLESYVGHWRSATETTAI